MTTLSTGAESKERINRALGVLSSGERILLAAIAIFYNAQHGSKLLGKVDVKAQGGSVQARHETRQIIATLLLSYEGW